MSQGSSPATVLVTGGSGFVAAYAVTALLRDGYAVRATVRSAAREADVRAMVTAAGADPGRSLSVAVADLTSDDGWAAAATGCDYVLHVASPFSPAGDEDELIIPARDGALRVLRAARDAGARRVVMTSSFAAIGYSPKKSGEPYDETDWTDPAGDISAYIKSKTIAERAAWEFMARAGGGLELAVINPTAIFGPVLGPDYSGSLGLVRSMLDGSMPATPRVYFGVTDVRDVAALHVRAMTAPQAAGQRFLAVSGPAVSLLGIAAILRQRLGDAAAQAPARELPDDLVRELARTEPSLREAASRVGIIPRMSDRKARALLGWNPRPPADTIAETAQSLLRLAAAD